MIDESSRRSQSTMPFTPETVPTAENCHRSNCLGGEIISARSQIFLSKILFHQ